ncbi:TonB-dependent receptor [Rhodoferax antarcticus]|nr:TonB-dependent receptor [Rhodoferax antarcticus]APW46101.1 TonB-dependent receptor [Rhodoferax antarcticus]
MTSFVFSVCHRAPVRLCASALAVFATFPVLAQGQAAGTLGEVVVTATRFPVSADVLPFGVSVITQADIQRTGATTVNDALVKLLGVPGRTDLYGSGDYGLDLRGFGTTASSNQVVVLDGIRLNESDLSGARLSGIAIDSIEKIEVIRGSGAVLYGEGATGGVIVITTKAGAGSERSNQANLYTAVGTYGLREFRAGATLATGGFSLDVSGNQRDTDNHRDNFKSSADGSAATAQWSNDWLRLGASYAHDTLDAGLPGPLSAADYQANPVQTKYSNNHGNIVNTRKTVFAQADVGAWQLALDVGQRSKSLDSMYSGSASGYDVDANTLAVRAKHESTWGSARNAITFGRDQTDWKKNQPAGVSEQKSHGLYAQDDLTLAGGTRVSVGYRSENISQTDDRGSGVDTDQRQTAWELGLTQSLSKTWSVFGRIGTSFRLANMDELYPLYALPGAVLQPQTSRDFEMGSRWTYEAGRVELRYYRYKLNNELGYDPTVANANSWNGLGANVNFDPTLRQGFELETHYSLSKTLALQGNLGIREAKFTEGAHNGKTVPLVAGTTVAVRANWQPLPAHSVNAGVVWVSDQHVDFNNTCKVPAYATADARYAYQMGNVELSLGISNLFDKKYFTLAYDCASGGGATSIYPEAGRAFAGALRVKF